MSEEKIRENRLRRVAERRGYRLVKSRRRDPLAVDFGTYGVIDPDRNNWVFANTQTGYGMTLDQIEEWLYPDQMGQAAG